MVLGIAAGAVLAVIVMWFGIIWVDDPEVDEKLTNTMLVVSFFTVGGLWMWGNRL